MVERLGAPIKYFTDSFLLAGEGHFFWRRFGVGRRAVRRPV